jgi:hypothetical protein
MARAGSTAATGDITVRGYKYCSLAWSGKKGPGAAAVADGNTRRALSTYGKGKVGENLNRKQTLRRLN